VGSKDLQGAFSMAYNMLPTTGRQRPTSQAPGWKYFVPSLMMSDSSPPCVYDNWKFVVHGASACTGTLCRSGLETVQPFCASPRF